MGFSALPSTLHFLAGYFDETCHGMLLLSSRLSLWKGHQIAHSKLLKASALMSLRATKTCQQITYLIDLSKPGISELSDVRRKKFSQSLGCSLIILPWKSLTDRHLRRPRWVLRRKKNHPNDITIIIIRNLKRLRIRHSHISEIAPESIDVPDNWNYTFRDKMHKSIPVRSWGRRA